jgi:hypothetical protein
LAKRLRSKQEPSVRNDLLAGRNFFSYLLPFECLRQPQQTSDGIALALSGCRKQDYSVLIVVGLLATH